MRNLIVNTLQLGGLFSLMVAAISAIVAWDLYRTARFEPHGTTMLLTAVVAAPAGVLLWSTAQTIFQTARARG
jgi:hypothetical protein